MSEGKTRTQSSEQAGLPGKAEGVGLEVGAPHSSKEAPVMGVERRRGTCSDVSRGTWPKAPQGDTPRGRKVPDTDFDCGGNAKFEPDSESRIREIRPSGLMRGRSRELRTDNCGLFNLTQPAPAYSTDGAWGLNRLRSVPALKGWAILVCPSGTGHGTERDLA